MGRGGSGALDVNVLAPPGSASAVDARVQARLGDAVARLRALDPSAWDTGLSPAGARAVWAAAVDALVAPDAARELPGTVPTVLAVIGSANVFTAPLEWMAGAWVRGVRVRVKPASGHEAIVHAMAGCLPDGEGTHPVQVHCYAGGDAVAERALVGGTDAVLAFGGAEAMTAIAARLPTGVRFFPFGPKFGLIAVEALDVTNTDVIARDHALHDGRGCMSPAAIVTLRADLVALDAAMHAMDLALPPGPIAPGEATASRTRDMLARVVGSTRPRVLSLPVSRFSPLALSRRAVVHVVGDWDEARVVLAPHVGLLGTIASTSDIATSLGVTIGRGGARLCAPGEMQTPPACRWHDGRDVWADLWSS